ncbi:MAG: ferrochelatase [Rhodobacteraceae bacterium]|nr:ferrochelatase [Paracoccaceae bacterium]
MGNAMTLASLNAPNNAPHAALARAEKVGVLLANLGTPSGTDYWSMRRYLSEFLSDQRVVDMPRWKWQPILQMIILTIRPSRSGAAYAEIWNKERDESPLLTITRDQTTAIAAQLTARYGDQVMVDFCMRYGAPSTRSKLRAMINAGCTRILFFPLYPHYAGATTASANDQVFRVLMQEKHQPALRTVPAYYGNPAYISALANSVTEGYAKLATKPDHLVCSYHGLPQRYVDEGDPYYDQCVDTTKLLQQELGWDEGKAITAFQSRFGREEWLKPYAVVEVARLAAMGKKNIAVIAPAFSADCIETLEEISGEIREAFIAAGGETFTYIPCLNDQAAHISALTGLIQDNLKGWLD